MCQHVLSLIGNDINFETQIPTEINEGDFLVTFDVISLYTNIPPDLGLTAIEYWLDYYGRHTADHFHKEFILLALSIVPQENIFHFDNGFNKQVQGTAIGTKMAPTNATVMRYLEKQLYVKYKKTQKNCATEETN